MLVLVLLQLPLDVLPWSYQVRQLVRSVVIATAVLAATGSVPDLAFAQRSGRGGGGNRGGSGATARPAPVGRAVPRGAQPVYRGGYRGNPRAVYLGRPAYWGGLGLGWGYGGWGGYGAWGPGWWGPGYASSMWWPGFGWWGGPAMYAPPYAAWGVTSDARFLVSPRTAEVYIDGALAGIVDQYDGVFQSLRLSPGTHQVSLYLDGHRRHDTNVYVAPGSTLKLRHTMEPLAVGAPPDERPTPPVRSPAPAGGADDGSDAGGASAGEIAISPEPRAPRAPREPRAPRAPRDSRAPREISGDAGLLVIRIQPADAEIVIDGQRWQTPDRDEPLEVRVPAGRVRVEVRKPGFAPFSTEIAVEPGKVTPLNVNLPPQGQPL